MKVEDILKFLEDVVGGSAKAMEIFKYLRATADLMIGRIKQEQHRNTQQTLLLNEISQDMSTLKHKEVDTMKKNCYKRADGRWQYSKQQNGQRYYAIANTYRELVEKIKDIKPKQIKGIKQKTKKTSYSTFIQYFQYFIDSYIKCKDISNKSKEDWQRNLTKDITPAFKYVKLEDLTTEKIQTFLYNIKESRKREKLYQRIVKVLKKAYATGKIKRDITLGIEKPETFVIQERRPLTLHEQISLLKKVKKTKFFAFAMFSIIVGTRREETLRFNLETDINEKKCQIHIKGTKTDNADRYVTVSKTFIEFLKNNMPKPTFGFKLDYVTKKFRDMFLDLNIQVGYLHSLRHTCSANLYFLGAKDKYRQMQLGHASISTTNDIYTNIIENTPPRHLRLIYGDLYPKFD